MVIQGLARAYKRRRDTVWLSIYVLAILSSGIFVGGMVGTAFSGYSGFKQTLRPIFDLMPIELINLAAVAVGFYLGLLFLLFLDFKKRIQSILMIAGTVLGFFIFAIEGVLFPSMSLLDFTLVVITFGMTVATVGGKTLREVDIDPDSLWSGIITNKNNEPVEFQQAATYLKVVVTLFVALAFFEAHTFYEPLLVTEETFQPNVGGFRSFTFEGSERQVAANLFFSLVLIGTFTRFLAYEASERIIFIGPPRSGKTHTIIGLYTQAQNSDFNARNASPFLNRQKDRIVTDRDWAPETEAEVHEMGFVYNNKGIFSKNVTIDGLDYPGEYVYYIAKGLQYVNEGMEVPSETIDEALPSAIEFGADKRIGDQISEEFDSSESRANAFIENARKGPPDSNFATFEDAYMNHIQKSSGATDTDSESSDTKPDLATDTDSESPDAKSDLIYTHMIRSVLPRVMKAETLAFVFDINQALEFEQGGDAKYVAAGQYNNIAAAADADRYIGIATKADLYADKFEQERRYRPADDPDAFQSFVESELLSTPFNDQIKNLQLDVHPVYLETETEDGEKRPHIPIKPYGTEELLQELGRK